MRTKSDDPDDVFEAPQVLIPLGRKEQAAYIDPGVPSYRGNPYIEALPAILTEDESMKALALYPKYNEDDRQAPTHLRLHMIQSALDFFAPLPVHLDLEQRFSRLIRAGYKYRHPLERVLRIKQRSMAAGFTIIGFPGVGKSTAVEEILQLYPQVVYHSRYRGRDFTRTQIVWLKIECPHDGSTRGFCINFFQAVDSLIGTNYRENFAKGRRTVDELMPDMARVASMHGLGVLVIDDIQFLRQAKSGGSSKMLNFFTYLVTTIGVPVVPIGTYKAKHVLTGEFSQVRRGTGQGDLVWDKMEEGEWQQRNESEAAKVRMPGDWQVFLESLWLYQFTRTPSPLTRELSHALYEETQGITDFAVKVYVLAQLRAITTNEPGQERLTEAIFHSVAQDSLKTAQKVLNALRLGNMKGLEEIEDIQPIDIEPYMQKAYADLQRLEKLRSLSASSRRGGATTGNADPPTETLSESAGGTKVHTKSSKRRSKKGSEAYPEGDLRAAISVGADNRDDTYETLRQAGHIQSAKDPFLGGA